MRPKLHPACAAWPAMPEPERQLLISDIKQNGLLDPITLTQDGLLLDGKVRWDCCAAADVEPRTVVYDGDDPVSFVLSKNQHRKHLTKSQLGLVMAELARLPLRLNQHSLKKLHSQGLTMHSVSELSKKSGVSKSYIKYGRQLIDKAAPNVLQMVKDGAFGAEIAVAAATTYEPSVQATWTTEQAKQIGSEIVQARPSNVPLAKRRPAKVGQAQTTAPMLYDHPPQPLAVFKPSGIFATAEESGVPHGGTIEELNAFHEEYGRTPLHPKVFTDLRRRQMAAEMATSAVTMVVMRLAEPDKLFERLDDMLAYTSDKTKTNGLERDFAAIARKMLVSLGKELPIAIEYLIALKAKLDARKADKGKKPAADPESAPAGVALH